MVNLASSYGKAIGKLARPTFLLLLALVLLLLYSEYPAQGVTISARPTILRAFGSTTYEINFAFAVDGQTIGGKSRLQFPLDGMLVGGLLELASSDSTHSNWSLSATVLKSIQDPGLLMKDHDWITFQDQEYKISYTESDAQGSNLIMAIEGTARVLRISPLTLMGVLGYRHQMIEQTIIGYDGWQLDENLNRIPISGDERALEYKINYATPYLGGDLRLMPVAQATISARALGLLVMSWDRDVHVLRGKTAKATAVGGGMTVGLRSRAEFELSPDLLLHLELVADATYLAAFGTQTQRGEEVGVQSVDYSTTSDQFQVGINLGLAFSSGP